MPITTLERLPTASRPTWAEIHMDRLAHNFRVIRARVGERVKICAVVKAEAYGHGAVAIARSLESVGADWFGVAVVEEGIALREAGIARPILCFGIAQGQEALVLEYRLTPVVFDVAQLERLDACARAHQRVLDVHLEVDTGMGRTGVPLRELETVLRAFERLHHVRLDGLMTHFAAADDPDRAEFTRAQIARFHEAVRTVEAWGFRPTYRHLANSAGVRAYPEAWGNMVRPGGLLYGLWSGPCQSASSSRAEIVVETPTGEDALQPVLSLHTRIVFLKEVEAGTPLGYGSAFVTQRRSRIATLPIGYHDGYRRALSNRGRVLVRGRFAPIVGRVSMDWTLVDVTDVSDARVGDEVILIGQANDQRITAEELAELCGTISYEITCGISARVPRVLVAASESARERTFP
ncbi:MAG: alanine racemase [Blastocatellia bacterium]|nr:alanine racemase [Blastocatellia bacterium]MCS7158350.1 alanine racemase [Blastocatellia bacterium]MCX7752856.1 alanine racemase [Blastocatellia bacterium]MDW8167912.1 alanine racemase [Acidobacteriota bacterium]MDW8255937.1 alanine racemase [Acidobacteriota bacterium]